MAEPPSAGFTEAEARRLADEYEKTLRTGHAFGTIVLPKPDRSFAVVEGVEIGPLRKGPGHYDTKPVKTAIPGQGKTVGIAGHRTTYLAPFGPNDRLQPGDEIVMKMPYGTFTYEVQKKETVPPSKIEVLDDKGYERLVLTACHPPFSAAERLVVFAKLVRMEPADRPAPERLGQQADQRARRDLQLGLIARLERVDQRDDDRQRDDQHRQPVDDLRQHGPPTLLAGRLPGHEHGALERGHERVVLLVDVACGP